jgi:hypothetical protein
MNFMQIETFCAALRSAWLSIFLASFGFRSLARARPRNGNAIVGLAKSLFAREMNVLHALNGNLNAVFNTKFMFTFRVIQFIEIN